MRIAVTGSSGLIGSALVPLLEKRGHSIVRLVRRQPSAPDELGWDPEEGRLDRAGLQGVDAVVHLAGVGIGERRWTRAQKERIRQSRVRGTSVLSEALAALDRPPTVLVSASAVGYYGDRGDEELTEESGSGRGFLAEVVKDWEGATAPARAAGIRVVNLRSGIVLSSRGGALGRILPLFKLGLGGRLGSGRQRWSWIALDDEVGLIDHALSTPSLAGPLNATAPRPVTNAEFTRALARVLGRPSFLAVPRPTLSVVMGRELVDEMLLASQRVVPARALSTGYEFAHPDLQGALRSLLGRPES